MVKGFLLALLPTIVTVAGLTNVHIPNQETLTLAVDAIATAVQIGLGLIAGIITFIGAVRKIFTTLSGENDVLKSIDRGEFD